MITRDDSMQMDCEQARTTCHEILDGDLMDAQRQQVYRRHLRACTACRDADRELRAVGAALRGLADQPFPDTALQRVWGETRRPASRPARPFDWRAAVAAAIVLGATIGFWQLRVVPGGPSEAEIARATAQTRLVLRLTADALRSTERAVVDRVLIDEVSPALRRLPLAWPAATPTEPTAGPG